jgi:hypothetical protein
VSPRHRRELLLDSGAVSALAGDDKRLDALKLLLKTTYRGSLRIPIPVMTECRTGDPRRDARLNHLLNRIDAGDEFYIPLTIDLANRAGVLRYEALKRHPGEDISPIDAQVVAIAEELSRYSAVTILTGDPKDMQTLVNLTGRSNIAVEKIS